MISYKTATSTNDLEQILELQKINLPQKISSEEKQKEGFVTVEHNFHLLKQMNDVCPHIIAKDTNRVVGYALSMHPKFGNAIEILKPMFSEINQSIKKICITEDIQNNEENFKNSFIVMGQICIDKLYRKQGIFRNLYTKMQQEISPQFTTIITEVDSLNTRSLQAHYAIGFKTLSKYKADGRNWELIYLK